MTFTSSIKNDSVPYQNSERYKTTKSERLERVINTTPAIKNSSKSLMGYLGDENVSEFNKNVNLKSFSKALNPQIIDSAEVMYQECLEYFSLCHKYEQLPTISTLALYVGLDISTLYSYANDSSNPCCKVVKLAIQTCHSYNEQSALNGVISPNLFQFLAVNYYGLKNTQTVDIKPIMTDSTVNNENTLKIIQEQVAKESAETQLLDNSK